MKLNSVEIGRIVALRKRCRENEKVVLGQFGLEIVPKGKAEMMFHKLKKSFQKKERKV